MNSTTSLTALKLAATASGALPAAITAAQSQVTGLPTATGLGVSLSVKTDAQRLAYTPVAGEPVYATDTGLCYIGNGTTAGGVLSDLPWDTATLARLQLIVPRHRKVLPAIRACITSASTADIPKGVFLGNSVVHGSGAVTAANRFTLNALSRLRAYAGVGVDNDWWTASKVYGVGGTTVANVVPYLAHALSPTPSNYWRPARSVTHAAGNTFAVLMTIRNDANVIPIADFTMMLRASLLQCKRQGLDAVVVIEPPGINVTTGVVTDTSANWEPWAEVARQVAADEGASLVDGWRLFDTLRQLGVDLRTLMFDTVHPNDIGHLLIGALLYKCLLAPPPSGGYQYDRAVTDGRVAAYAQYNSVLRVTQAISGGAVTLGGLQQSTTARAVQLVEGAAPRVYVVPTSGQLRFPAPAGAKGAIVTYLLDPTNTGTATIAYNGITVASGTASATGSLTREWSVYYSFAGLNTTFTDLVPHNLLITATGGQLCVTGVTFIGPLVTEGHDKWPAVVETGTWSDSTQTSGSTGLGITTQPARTSSTVGDTATITWHGTDLTMVLAAGQTHGKATVATDGGAAGTYDFYNSAVAEDVFASAITQTRGLTEGWHTTVITVATKNASSGGNTVKITGFIAMNRCPDPSIAYVGVASGETVALPDSWRTAAIDSVVSGTPVLRFNKAASSVTLSGGAAIVRLAR